jgi:hypothetical protein
VTGTAAAAAKHNSDFKRHPAGNFHAGSIGTGASSVALQSAAASVIMQQNPASLTQHGRFPAQFNNPTQYEMQLKQMQ